MATFDLLGTIADEGYAEVKALEGQPIRVEQWNHEASWDAVRHYAYGLGDDNPLFCDPAYGEATPYGTLLAPPTFLFTAFDGAVGAGLPGVQPMYAGAAWRFFRRVRRNTHITAEAEFGPVSRVQGRHARDLVIQTAVTRYRDAGGNLLADCTASTFRVPRRDATDGLAYEQRDEHRYDDEELDAIAAAATTEFRRGSGGIGSLEVGDQVPTVVKGPIGRIDMTAYYAGLPGSPGYKSCELAWKYRRWAATDPDRLPTNYDPSYFGERVLPSIGHQDPEAARELGMPNAYNNGPQRVGWFAHCVTNWMGDSAFLRELDVRLRRPEVFGDTVWIGGEVTEVIDGPCPVATLQLSARNQLGEMTATASAVVAFDDYGRADEDGA